MIKKCATLGLFALSLLANPYLACSSSDAEAEFEYSEQDMKTAILGEWQGKAELDGKTVEFSLLLEQASAKSQTQGSLAPRIQPQCSSRSFVKPAAACASLSTMPLVGTLSSENPVLNGAVTGELMAGLILSNARLSLRSEGGSSLSGQLENQALEGGSISGEQIGTFSLSRP